MGSCNILTCYPHLWPLLFFIRCSQQPVLHHTINKLIIQYIEACQNKGMGEGMNLEKWTYLTADLLLNMMRYKPSWWYPGKGHHEWVWIQSTLTLVPLFCTPHPPPNMPYPVFGWNCFFQVWGKGLKLRVEYRHTTLPTPGGITPGTIKVTEQQQKHGQNMHNT